MLHRFLLVAATAATVSFTSAMAATAPAPVPNPLVADGRAQIPAIKTILDDTLVSYPETRFRSVRLVRTGFTDKPDIVTGFCGEMNTKNRMGGFTGWSKFFVSTDPVLAGAPDRLYVFGMRGTLDAYSPGATDQFVATLCGISPKPLDDRDYSSAFTFSAGK